MKKIIKKTSLILSVFILFIGCWVTYVTLFNIPSHILPSPLQFFSDLITNLKQGNLQEHIATTLIEIAVGSVIGIFFGLLTGYFLAKNHFLERIFTPYVILIQTIPKISIAPLFLLWFGLGVESKIALVVLVVFFPIMVNFVVGIRSVDKNMQDLLQILHANRFQKFFFVELYYSMPSLLSGIKVASTYAITGAVIGEMIGAKSGLGFLIILGSETYDISLILTSVLLLSIIGLVLYKIIDLVEKRLLHWSNHSEMVF
ncbi:ABC transporter permease [Metabacillus halosaccharovorans]|uniref:ABC transporter permease n=1 Tax=Metabacillus halosaccharovorans TaxID=930124 RepID=A0ABT3DLE4_9BACI|nr:ABC transporter permease [Metabacillus halosaccharovorans]MCV9887872.1 ABC transporter permease [Metabacillus halosaccharovorans]